MKKKKRADEYEDFEPEEGYSEEDYEYLDDEEDDGDEEEGSRGAPRRGSGLVVFLTAAVLLCAAALVVVLALSMLDLSGFSGSGGSSSEADPEALMHQSHLVEESQLKESPILETTEEPTEETTVPPESNPYDQYDFQYNQHNYLYCMKQESYVGVDVSAFQGDIDWAQVKNSGIEFAMLRLGYRGYGAAGNMVEDEYIQQNLAGTAAVGMPIGVYFFSQATSLDEVYDEIEFMLKILGDRVPEYPIVLDWETIADVGRTQNVDRRTLTDMLKYFCDEMSARGYQPMVYFNWTQASKMLYLSELEDYPFWLALYQDRMTYPFKVEMWQYTSTGVVPGIDGEVDLDLYIPAGN